MTPTTARPPLPPGVHIPSPPPLIPMRRSKGKSLEPPMNFGGLEPEFCEFEKSKVLVWPIPYERTVSHGTGAKHGPSAIIEASRYMEAYDEEIDGEPCVALGIHTLPEMDVDRDPEEMAAALGKEAEKLLKLGRFICSLGGEHSISSPIVQAFHKVYPNLSVLQIDAHADLKDSYRGNRLSHACTMRRIVEVCPAVQVGIRSLSAAEARAIPTLPTQVFYATDIVGRDGWIEQAVDALTEDVYLSIDVDGLDPSIMPATGTPEPGGLGWNEVLALIETLTLSRRVVGMDLVELSDGPEGGERSATLAARLIYKTLGFVFREAIPQLDLNAPNNDREEMMELYT